MMLAKSVFFAAIILVKSAHSSEYMKREHSLVKPYQGTCKGEPIMDKSGWEVEYPK